MPPEPLDEAGRVLSQQNASAIQSALETLSSLLKRAFGADTTDDSANTPPAKKDTSKSPASEAAIVWHVTEAQAQRSFDEITDLLRKAIRAAQPQYNGGYYYCYPSEVYTDTVIYSERVSGDDNGKLFRRAYSISDTGEVTLGTPVQVQRVVTYEPVGTAQGAPATEAAVETDITGDTIPLVEKAVGKNGTATVKLIQPGWGSSAYYPAEVLKTSGPQVFKKGLHMHVDHPSATEEADRPERSVATIGGVLESDARWLESGPAGAGLYAEIKPVGTFAGVFEQLAPHIGVSIRAEGKAKAGEAEGRKGQVLEGFTAAHSVDFVTVPGAGGQVLQLFESARTRVAGQPQPKEDAVSETELAALRESLAANQAELARLREAAVLRDARDQVREALAGTQLHELTQTRITSDLVARAPLKEGALDREAFTPMIETSVKAALEEVALYAGSGQVVGLGGTPPSGEETHTALVAMFRESGLSPEAAEIAARGTFVG